MFAAWSRRLTKEGHRPPSDAHGVHAKLLDLTRAEAEAAGYITTAGSFHAANELADRGGKSARYGNRTTWQLLSDARNGDGQAAVLWREWELASKGRCAWDNRSPYLRTLAQEHTEVVAPEAESEVVAGLNEIEWQKICRDHDPAELLAEAEESYVIGLAAERGDRSAALGWAALAVAELLEHWGLRPRPPDRAAPPLAAPPGRTAAVAPSRH